MLGYISQTLSSNLQVSSVQITSAVCVGLYVIYRLSGTRNRKLPPGPWAFPVIGNLVQLSKSSYLPELFCEWRNKYGDVFMMKMGCRPVVVLNGFASVREALITKQNDFACRPQIYSLDLFTEGGKNMAFAKFGPVWQLQRKLAHKAFRQFASGDHLEVLLSAALLRLFAKLDTAAENQDTISPAELLTAYTADLQNAMCFGLEILEEDDPHFLAVKEGIEHIDEKIGKGMMADYFPWFRHVYKIYKTQTLKEIYEFMEVFESYLKKLMAEKRKKLDKDNIHDITSMLIAVQNEHEAELSAGTPGVGTSGAGTSGAGVTKSGTPQLTDQHFLQMIRDIFGGGTNTSRFTLTWFVQYMAAHPNIQDELYEEIVSNVGKDHKITQADRAKLPLVEATLFEVMRCRTLVPLGIPHATTCRTTCMGYEIPAGTMVFPNIHSCHMDPEYWPDPEQFRPERFLNADGTASSVRPGYLPFSAGRRICVGESLAKTTLPFSVASLMQRYEFLPIPGEVFTQEAEFSFLATEPKAFRLMVKVRQ